MNEQLFEHMTNKYGLRLNSTELSEIINIVMSDKTMISPTEAANLLNISLRKIYYYMKDGTLPFYRLTNSKNRYLKPGEVLGLLQRAS
jgi:excisionase family DNA binding protein